MSKNRTNKGLWEYLEATGVLEKGTDEEIKAVKHAYRKKYLLTFKQRQRAIKPEYTINFSKKTGEYDRVAQAATRHNMSLTAFTRSSVLAYLDRTYVVPNSAQIARLEQNLSECLNEIKTITQTKEKYFWEREQKLEAIEKRIEKLEVQINTIFRTPPLFNDRQNKIA